MKGEHPSALPFEREDTRRDMCSRYSHSTGGPHIGEGYLLVQAMTSIFSISEYFGS